MHIAHLLRYTSMTVLFFLIANEHPLGQLTICQG